MSETVELTLFLIYTTALVLGGALCGRNAYLFWKLRHEHCLHARLPQMVILQHVTFALALVLFSWSTRITVLLGAVITVREFIATSTFFIITYSTSIVFRMWFINWKFNATQNLMKMQWKRDLRIVSSLPWTVRYGWPFEHRRRFLKIWAATSLLLYLAFLVPLTILKVRVLTVMIIAMILLICTVIPLVSSAFFLTKESRDIFGIGREKMEVFFVWVFFICCVLMMSLLMNKSSVAYAYSFEFLLLGTAFTHSQITTTRAMSRNRYFLEATSKLRAYSPKHTHVRQMHSIPTHSALSKQSSKRDQKSATHKGSTENFKRVLADYDGFQLFVAHCIREFSAEGVLFVVAYMRFKQALFETLSVVGIEQLPEMTPDTLALTVDIDAGVSDVEEDEHEKETPREKGARVTFGKTEYLSEDEDDDEVLVEELGSRKGDSRTKSDEKKAISLLQDTDDAIEQLTSGAIVPTISMFQQSPTISIPTLTSTETTGASSHEVQHLTLGQSHSLILLKKPGIVSPLTFSIENMDPPMIIEPTKLTKQSSVRSDCSSADGSSAPLTGASTGSSSMTELKQSQYSHPQMSVSPRTKSLFRFDSSTLVSRHRSPSMKHVDTSLGLIVKLPPKLVSFRLTSMTMYDQAGGTSRSASSSPSVTTRVSASIPLPMFDKIITKDSGALTKSAGGLTPVLLAGGDDERTEADRERLKKIHESDFDKYSKRALSGGGDSGRSSVNSSVGRTSSLHRLSSVDTRSEIPILQDGKPSDVVSIFPMSEGGTAVELTVMVARCTSMIAELFEKFVSLEAPHAINISSMARDQCFESVGDLFNPFNDGIGSKTDCKAKLDEVMLAVPPLDAALVQVMRMLKGDSFHRFTETAEYHTWNVSK